jgi:putative membrane protein
MINGMLNAGLYFLITSAIVIIAILLFDLCTKYKIWSEINNGNVAVAFSTGGIALGVAIIMKSAIAANDKLLDTIIWGGVGTLALIIVYLGFELLTPKLNVSEEIGKGNKAVGLISLVFSIAFSLIIGASIS